MATKTINATATRKKTHSKARDGKRRAAYESQAVYKTVDDLAREIGISRQATYAALRRGTIPSIRIGKRFVLPRAAIAEWLRTAGTPDNRAILQ